MRKHVGIALLSVVLVLITLGVVMLLSTSARFASDASADMYALLRKQGLWLVLGGCACVGFAFLDYRHIARISWIFVIVTTILLVLCYVPHVGKKVNGAYRWISLAGWTVQPSEFAKLALICFFAFWLGRHQRRIGELYYGLWVPVGVLIVPALLIFFERDLGTTFLIGVVFVVMLFCAGTRMRYLLPVPIIGVAAILGRAWLIPESRARLMSYFDMLTNPDPAKDGKAYQVYQALIAFGSGGQTGLGLGNGRQKMYYVPEAHTDFVFPIVGEELGLWVALGVVFCFLVMALAGGWISVHAPDPVGVLLGVGITTSLCVQAVMNLSVVTGLMPNKGLPLPFISYGGSNLFVCLIFIGMLFNLLRNSVVGAEMPGHSVRPSTATPRL